MTFDTCLHLFKIEAMHQEGFFSVLLFVQKFFLKKPNNKNPRSKPSDSTSDLFSELTVRKYQMTGSCYLRF